MERRNIFLGAIVILAVILLVVYIKSRPSVAPLDSIPQTSVEKTFEEKFNLEIPDDRDRAELTSATGEGSGLATRKYEEGIFNHTVLADLADPEDGYFYQGWLVKGKMSDEDYALISTGVLNLVKGGYLIEYTSVNNYLDYSRVLITKEKVRDDRPEETVLEGSF